jgi:hypothetical protein
MLCGTSVRQQLAANSFDFFDFVSIHTGYRMAQFSQERFTGFLWLSGFNVLCLFQSQILTGLINPSGYITIPSVRFCAIIANLDHVSILSSNAREDRACR